MLNIALHKNVITDILKDIYSDPFLNTILGFKGGTAALLFYGLPRFSVDLDFDFLDTGKKPEVQEKVKEIAAKYGLIKEAIEKRHTLFLLLNYRARERNLKIEISKRPSGAVFEVKQYLGISMLVMKQDAMVAGKLAALLTRNTFASRDMFDLWYFLKNHWEISENTLREKTALSTKEALDRAIKKVEAITKAQILQGLGELLDEKQQAWARDELKADLLFYLKRYASNLPER